MQRGAIILWGAAVLALAACAGNDGKLEIRASSTPLASGAKPVPLRIAEARGQLRLGNVGLALESFRKALRDDPASVDALSGTAICYDRMGRFDLSRRHYEAALAISPGDVQLLQQLAGSLDLQNRAEEAASVRGEIADRQLAVAAESRGIAAVASAAVASQPASPSSSAPPVLAVPETELAAAAPPVRSEVPEQVASARAAPVAEATKPILGPSTTIKLPAPRAAPAVSARTAQARKEFPPAAPAKPMPRLVRLSRGEVALVTTGAAIWRTITTAQSVRSATLRFVPLRPSTESAHVRLLNAARVHRLAARNRAYLAGQGWHRVSIGDAKAVRARSIIFYPTGQRTVAQQLSARFGFDIAPAKGLREVTVFLGRDSIRGAAGRAQAS